QASALPPQMARAGLGRAGQLVVRAELHAQLRLEPSHGVALELAYPLAGEAELLADRVERPGLALEAEPQLENSRLALAELGDRRADRLAAERLAGFLGRVD